AVGFASGSPVGPPAAVVLWAAPFGAFVPGAPSLLAAFLRSGAAPWGPLSPVVLLFPPGPAGPGPAPPSARLARFLPLWAAGS
ncbi:hypothetical protein C3R30_21525, partial [Mycobacterium tuberculosis]